MFLSLRSPLTSQIQPTKTTFRFYLKIHESSHYLSPSVLSRLLPGLLDRFPNWFPDFNPLPLQANFSAAAKVTLLKGRSHNVSSMLKALQWLKRHPHYWSGPHYLSEQIICTLFLVYFYPGTSSLGGSSGICTGFSLCLERSSHPSQPSITDALSPFFCLY